MVCFGGHGADTISGISSPQAGHATVSGEGHKGRLTSSNTSDLQSDERRQKMKLKAIHSIQQHYRLGYWDAEFTMHGRENKPVDSATICLFEKWGGGVDAGQIIQSSCSLDCDTEKTLINTAIQFAAFASRQVRSSILEGVNAHLKDGKK